MIITYLKIIRPINCVMSIIAVLTAIFISASSLILNLPAIYALVAAFVICGAGMVINDYFDIEIDKINRPERPLPSGKIGIRAALIYSFILFTVGIIFAFFVNIYVLIIAIVNSIVEILYAWKIKKTAFFGNLFVSYLVASLFIYGGLVTGNFIIILPLALLAFLANMGREIFKTCEDVKGDRKMNANTLAVRFGVDTARRVGYFFILLTVLLSPIPYLLKMFGISYLIIVTIADMVFLLAIIGKKKSDFCKYGMIVGLIAFIAGTLL